MSTSSDEPFEDAFSIMSISQDQPQAAEKEDLLNYFPPIKSIGLPRLPPTELHELVFNSPLTLMENSETRVDALNKYFNDMMEAYFYMVASKITILAYQDITLEKGVRHDLTIPEEEGTTQFVFKAFVIYDGDEDQVNFAITNDNRRAIIHGLYKGLIDKQFDIHPVATHREMYSDETKRVEMFKVVGSFAVAMTVWKNDQVAFETVHLNVLMRIKALAPMLKDKAKNWIGEFLSGTPWLAGPGGSPMDV